MAKEHMIKDSQGKPVKFTCENGRFKTNLQKGTHPGKVLPVALSDDGVHSLWLEHVVDIHTGEEFFWLMWYKNGSPIIPESSVFNKNDLRKIIDGLATLDDALI